MIATEQDRLVVDLEDCPVMDSTFMGTIMGIALKLKSLPTANLQVVNANDRNINLLQSLGLDQFLELDIDGKVWADVRQLVRENVTQTVCADPLEKAENKQHVLDAHEALCRANADNEAKFRDVIEFLKQDVPETRGASA